MTHGELVNRAEVWLRSAGKLSCRFNAHFMYPARCGVVLTELTTWAEETPDVIGWREGFSVLLECKTSRSDYYADKSKPFRTIPLQGMGNYRFYFTPSGLLVQKNLPEHWGLLEVKGRSVQIVRPAMYQPCNDRNEKIMMASAYRRLQSEAKDQQAATPNQSTKVILTQRPGGH